jgi:hypothetical protein
MRHWRRFSAKRRAAFLAVMVFILTAAWASGQWAADWDEATATSQVGTGNLDPANPKQPSDLAAPLPGAPEAVFIQKTTAFRDQGNALVTVELTPEQLAAKRAEGTADFITVGDLSHQVILRDDGQGADAVAGNGLFTGIATFSDEDLAERAQADADNFNNSSVKEVPTFDGRLVTGTETPMPFDFAGFQAGRAVRLDPAVAFIDPEPDDSTGAEVTPGTAASTSGDLTSASAAALVLGTNKFQERVLLIRKPVVVADPARTYNPCSNTGATGGVWTFNHLMTAMANQQFSGIDPAVFTENWLKHWASTQTINGDVVATRTQINQIISQWKTASGGVKLDLNKSPLRLLAIVNRIDLRKTTGGGGGYLGNASGRFMDAGELRFVFGFVLKPGWNATGFIGPVQIPGQASGCRALPFSVIVEYGVPTCQCEAVRDWARRWVALRPLVPGTAAYNSKLQTLTEEVVRASADPTEPNFNNLNQLRTNEVAISPQTSSPYGQSGGPTWELREFQLTQFPFTFLNQTTVNDTPNDVWNNNALISNWITFVRNNGIQPAPLIFQGNNFLGGNSIVPDPPPQVVHHWNGPGLNLNDPLTNKARHLVSLAACNGCHRGETGTQFVHIDPSNSITGSTAALPAALSGFLTGINWGDPANGGNPVRTFDDLARREKDIKNAAGMSCAGFPFVNVAHVQASLQATGRLPADLFAGLPPIPFDQQLRISVDDFRRNRIVQVH